VHVVVTAERWAEIDPAVGELIGSRIELRLGDPLDSAVDPTLAAGVPQNRPGRGLSGDRLQLLTAVPRIDGRPMADGLPAATADLVRTVATRWSGPPAPGVRLLPTVVRPGDLPPLTFDQRHPEPGYPLGLDEDLEPVCWNPETDRHLVIFGDERSGKSTLLRSLIRQISARHEPDGVRFIVFDSKRGLLDLPYRPEQLIASATNGRDARGVIGANLDRLWQRLPTPSMTGDEVSRRARRGSPGPIFVIVDDYEQLADSAPLAELAPLLARASDSALHLVIARQAGGASRAVFETVYATLKDIGTPALVLSGPAGEDAVWGRTPMAERPPGRGIWVPRRGAERLMQATFDPQEW